MSALNYHHLRYFRVIAHERSLTRAAEQLHQRHPRRKGEKQEPKGRGRDKLETRQCEPHEQRLSATAEDDEPHRFLPRHFGISAGSDPHHHHHGAERVAPSQDGEQRHTLADRETGEGAHRGKPQCGEQHPSEARAQRCGVGVRRARRGHRVSPCTSRGRSTPP